MFERALMSALLIASCGIAQGRPLAYGDPTLPTPLDAPAAASTAAAPITPRWEVTSALISSERRVAVINGRSVTTGATIDGARVASIDSRGAWIEHRGRRIRLELPRGAGDRISAKTPTGR